MFDSAMTIKIGLLAESLATEIATKWSFASEIKIRNPVEKLDHKRNFDQTYTEHLGLIGSRGWRSAGP